MPLPPGKVLVPDRVHFQFPKDKELMMAAFSLFQAFINRYDAKMAANDVSGGTAQYKLGYTVDIAPEDWDLLMQLGVRLEYQPMKVPEGTIDMYVDWSDERLEQYKFLGKHVTQACSVMSGEDAPPLPSINRYQCDLSGNGVWGVQKSEYLRWWVPRGRLITLDELVTTPNGVWCGYLGYAGIETYVAAAKGMPVVEIIPADRPIKWLSKFTNSAYRVVVDNGDEERQVLAAVSSIEELITCLRLRVVQDKVGMMEQETSTAQAVEDLLQK